MGANTNDYNGLLTGLTVIPPANLLVAAGTQTYAGVDLLGYIGVIKLIFTWAGAAADGSHALQVSLLDSADNTTFGTNTALPTFASITATSGTVSVGLDTRANVKRYVQGKLLTASTTATFRSAMVAVALPQVI